MPVTYTLKNRIPAIVAQANARLPLVLEKTARDIEAGAKMKSRIDTGQMKNGWTSEEVDRETWRVYNAVEHTIYNEFPTDRRPAQPMLAPSIEEAREPFVKAMEQLYG